MNETIIRYLTMAIVVVTALPVHEAAHGWAADRLGDHTARDAGRLTLNPMAHLDLFGSLALVLFGFGWAKPVPINPSRMRKPRSGLVLTALAGPFSNLRKRRHLFGDPVYTDHLHGFADQSDPGSL